MFALIVSAVALLPISSEPAFCSKGGLHAPMGPEQAFFHGVATADTLLAGPGQVAHGSGGGHFGPTGPRPIYGQVVRVEAIGGEAAEGLPQGVEEVVVVPWDYDSLCRPLPWGTSAHWVEAGTAGMYIADLRAPEHWVEGKPTFDLHNPGYLPYTGREILRGMRHDAPIDSLLSPGELFELYRAMPGWNELDSGGLRSVLRLQEWIDSNPYLAGRSPAPELTRMLAYAAQRAELRHLTHPAMGTWRFQITSPGQHPITVYARTDSRPVNSWPPPQESQTAEHLFAAPEQLTILFTVADFLEDLPGGYAPRSDRQSYLQVREQVDSASHSEGWRGGLDVTLLRAALPRNPLAEPWGRTASAEARARDLSSMADPAAARFVRGEDGVLRVRQTFPAPAGGEILIEGEQLSTQVIEVPE